MSNKTLTRGWTRFNSDISDEAEEIFKKVLSGFSTGEYTPIAFATKISNGMTYSFFCNGRDYLPGSVNDAVIIDIYKPVKGEPRIKQIMQVKPD